MRVACPGRRTASRTCRWLGMLALLALAAAAGAQPLAADALQPGAGPGVAQGVGQNAGQGAGSDAGQSAGQGIEQDIGPGIEPTAAADAGQPMAGTEQYVLPFSLLGERRNLELRGVDGHRELVFGVRADQRVARARIDLRYSRSQALLQKLSHLKIMLNGELAATVPLETASPETASPETAASATAAPGPQDEAHAWLDLPVRFFRPDNLLSLQLIGHYTLQCENPVHPDLWADIDQSSRLVLDVEPLVLPDDLSLLPAPFFDRHDPRRLHLPFLVAGASDARIEAAGMIASWMGALASYRGADFSVGTRDLPAHGHGVVVAGAADLPPGLDLPALEGPTVALRTNPNDPAGKLLVVTGRTDQEIRTAARMLVLGGQVLAGPTALLKNLETRPRKPYDAPNWIPTDRPVALGELGAVGGFTRSGRVPEPITVDFRLPPDLSDWQTRDVPLSLRYRHSAQSPADEGRLDVLLNRATIRQELLEGRDERLRRWTGDDPSVQQDTVRIPLGSLSALSSLQFQFRYKMPERPECSGGQVDNWRSGIDPESTLDLSGVAHHKAMPDLAAFSTVGFPFTRMADLSETVAVLPDQAGDEEYGALLTWLGAAGRSTGLPASGIRVLRAAEAKAPALAGKDVLLVESGPPSALLRQWAGHVSAAGAPAAETEWSVGALIRQAYRWVAGAGETAGGRARAGSDWLAGFESPVTAGRSVVVLAAGDGARLAQLVEAFALDPVQGGQVQGGLAAWQGDRFQVLSRASSYYVGSLGAVRTVAWFLSRHPLLMLLALLLGVALAAAVFYLHLRTRARRRLQMDSE